MLKIFSSFERFALGLFILLFFLGVGLTFPKQVSAYLPSFPGAEGYGAVSIGGRGGRVIKVTNLNDSGAGSLREALTASGPRIVIFTVSGTITLNSNINITNPYLTVAGQTAPGEGITIKHADIRVLTDDVIIRYLRVRNGPGDTNPDDGNRDNISVNTANRVIIDHCSVSWSTNENTNVYNSHDITFQWNLIGEGLYSSTHPDGIHGHAMLVYRTNTIDGTTNLSVHHNLMAHNFFRNPEVQTGEPFEYVNNVVYNYSRGMIILPLNSYHVINLDVIGNYFRAGQDTPAGLREITGAASPTTYNGTLRLYLNGNLSPNRTSNAQAENTVVATDLLPYVTTTRNATDSKLTNITSAQQAYEDVSSYAGAVLPYRDGIDTRIVRELRNFSGKRTNDPSEVGGWETMVSAAGPTDTDNDGMPDTWEDTYGFNKNDAGDANLDADGDGYLNIEEYINGSQPIHQSAWQQSAWQSGASQVSFKDQRLYSSASNITPTTAKTLQLSTNEKLTNGAFNQNTTSWAQSSLIASTAPTSISGLKVWLKADAITGLNDGDTVTRWSGSTSTVVNGYQSSSTSRPTYRASVINGKPALQWDNVDDYMVLSNSSDILTNQTLGAYEIFAVAQRNPGTGSTGLLSGSVSGSLGGGTSFIRIDSTDFGEDFQGDNATFKSLNHGTALDNQWHVLSYQYPGTTFSGSRDGETPFSTTASTTNYTFNKLGSRGAASEVWDGYIAEVLVFDRQLTSTERLQMESYLGDKYGLNTQYANSMTISRNSSTKYYPSLNDYSVKIINTLADMLWSQTVTLGNTKNYLMTADVYTDGSAVTSSQAALYGQGTTLSTTYSSLGSGWYRLSAPVTGQVAASKYGVAVKSGVTAYVDNLSLYNYSDSGTLNSSIFDTGTDAHWQVGSYNVTTPAGTQAKIKVRSGNNADLSDAPDFNTCNQITSGDNIQASSSCTQVGHHYSQYQVVMSTSDTSVSPTFSSVTLFYDQGASLSSHSNSAVTSSAGPETCPNFAPKGVPNLFQINPSKTAARVFFSPVNNPADRYFISYSTSPTAEQHGVEVVTQSTGVIGLDISKLKPKTIYYFKVRAGNGCQPGEWSNILSLKTGQTSPSYLVSSARKSATRARTPATTVLGSEPEIPVEVLPSEPVVVASPTVKTVEPKPPLNKPTFLEKVFLNIRRIFGRL